MIMKVHNQISPDDNSRMLCVTVGFWMWSLRKQLRHNNESLSIKSSLRTLDYD